MIPSGYEYTSPCCTPKGLAKSLELRVAVQLHPTSRLCDEKRNLASPVCPD